MAQAGCSGEGALEMGTKGVVEMAAEAMATEAAAEGSAAAGMEGAKVVVQMVAAEGGVMVVVATALGRSWREALPHPAQSTSRSERPQRWPTSPKPSSDPRYTVWVEEEVRWRC